MTANRKSKKKMKVTIIKAQLNEATQAIKGLVAKDVPSAFSKVRLDASGCLSVTGSNGETQLEWRLDGDIKDGGTVTVPGLAFAAFVSAIPEGVVEIDGESGKKAKIECGGCVYRLSAGEAAEFPVMAGPKAEMRATLHIPATTLREMMRKVKFAVSIDITRRSICGVNIDLKDGMLSMTAIDGRRLAHIEYSDAADKAMLGMNVTLPAKTISLLYGLLDKMDSEDVDVLFDGSAMRFVTGKWAVTAKVLADTYPNWRQVVPENPPHAAELKREVFLEALGRVALASDEARGVKIVLSNGRVTFDARNDLSTAKIEIADCVMEDGVKGEFNVNPRLMKDALDAIDENDFSLHFDDANGSALKLTCSLPWVAVVMPYRKEG